MGERLDFGEIQSRLFSILIAFGNKVHIYGGSCFYPQGGAKASPQGGKDHFF